MLGINKNYEKKSDNRSVKSLGDIKTLIEKCSV